MSWVERVMVGVFMLAVVARLVGRHHYLHPPTEPAHHTQSLIQATYRAAHEHGEHLAQPVHGCPMCEARS